VYFTEEEESDFNIYKRLRPKFIFPLRQNSDRFSVL